MKVALVTGAGRGLGRCFAEFLSLNGFFVYAGVRQLTDKSKIEAEHIKTIKLDVQDDGDIKYAATIIRQEQGKLDLLINNAGLNKDTATNNHIELVTQLNSLDRRLIMRMVDVNAVGPLILIKEVLPLMQNGGFIINISSARASFQIEHEDNKGNYGYKASKVALNMFTKALLHDLPKNIHVAAVHPGSVRTDMNPGGALMPEIAAAKIYKIIENWQPKFDGSFLNNDGSIHPC